MSHSVGKNMSNTINVLQLLLLALSINLVNSSPNDYSDGFIVHTNPSQCTGSIIAPGWAITASHCFNSVVDSAQRNNDGDQIIEKGSLNRMGLVVRVGTNYTGDLWADPIRATSSKDSPDSAKTIGSVYWEAQIKRTIVHSKYVRKKEGSWKGYDIAILQLSDWKKAPGAGPVAPVCLPSKGFTERFLRKEKRRAKVSGYGKRQLPLCVTNTKGPEAFGVCNVTEVCQYHKQSFSDCRAFTSYDNKEVFGCQRKVSTPQSKRCKKLFETHSVSNSTIHVINGSKKKYLYTCYPKFSIGGWCATKDHETPKPLEIKPESGWGFCPEKFDPACTEEGSKEGEKDTTPMEIDVLSDEFCAKKLEANLKIEQPHSDFFTNKSKYLPLLEQSGLFCIGNNVSKDYSHDLFYFSDKKTIGCLKKDEIRPLLNEIPELKQYHVNGGPSCFGDSGGPTWVSDDGVPVQIGVFSYVLWGSCKGNQDPGYHQSLEHSLDWILKYVPEKEVCLR